MDKQTALYFGTFDPPHRGHLEVGACVLAQPDVASLWFVVSPQSPFKTDSISTNFEHRVAMCRLMADMLDASTVSDVEAALPQPSYTYQTLNVLMKSHPKDQFSLVMGGDNWSGFSSWLHYREIAAGHRIFLYPRPGYPDPDPGLHGKEIQQSVAILHAPLLPYSSTEIRQDIGRYLSLEGTLPEPVKKYIEEMGLYSCSGHDSTVVDE